MKCTKCRNTLSDSELVILDEKVYCKNCADLPKCFHCGEVISENYLLADNKHWHKHHFFCQLCGKLIENKEFFVANGRIICEGCKNTAPMGAVIAAPKEENEKAEETFGETKAEREEINGEKMDSRPKYCTLKQLTTKPYPAGIDITKREVLFCAWWDKQHLKGIFE